MIKGVYKQRRWATHVNQLLSIFILVRYFPLFFGQTSTIIVKTLKRGRQYKFGSLYVY